VRPYQDSKLEERHIRLISWDDIFARLFKENRFAKEEEAVISASTELSAASNYFQKMLLNIWRMEPHKQYYLDRNYAFEPMGDEGQSMVYFVAKINCNFHKLLRYRDCCQLILRERFSEDASQLVLKLVRLFTEERTSESEEEQKGEGEEEKGA
jgi:hypothetical protein